MGVRIETQAPPLGSDAREAQLRALQGRGGRGAARGGGDVLAAPPRSARGRQAPLPRAHPLLRAPQKPGQRLFTDSGRDSTLGFGESGVGDWCRVKTW